MKKIIINVFFMQVNIFDWICLTLTDHLWRDKSDFDWPSLIFGISDGLPISAFVSLACMPVDNIPPCLALSLSSSSSSCSFPWTLSCVYVCVSLLIFIHLKLPTVQLLNFDDRLIPNWEFARFPRACMSGESKNLIFQNRSRKSFQ